MPTVDQSLLLGLTEAVDARSKSAFDVSKIAKEISGNGKSVYPFTGCIVY